MGMTRTERSDLSKIVRMRMRVVRSEIKQKAAEALASVEKQLAAAYPMNDPRWKKISEDAEAMIRQTDKKIAALCREMGVPESFRPSLNLQWYSRGENATKNRRAELRNVAVSRIEARVKTGNLEADRSEAEILTRIAASGLESAEAVKFLADLPSADALVPKLMLEELESRLALPKHAGVDIED